MRSPELALELRSARPVASPELRQRVLALAPHEAGPGRRPRLPRPTRRFALAALAALVAVSVGGAMLHGLATTNVGRHGAARQSQAAPAAGKVPLRGPALRSQAPSEVVPTTPGRLQRYGAYLRLQVEDLTALSDATKRAIRFARLLGGYVAYVRYATPLQGPGAAAIVVRIPVGRVEDAIAEYASLGTILAQNVSILDVTKQVEAQATEIARLEADIARLEAGRAQRTQSRLAAEKARLESLLRQRAATVRRAQLARVSLELTTKPAKAVARGRFAGMIGGAGGLLLREGEILLYALIVGAPLVLLAAALLAAGRVRDRRLFERV
jgi:uncharacterized small protein (DUF1192 family)